MSEPFQTGRFDYYDGALADLPRSDLKRVMDKIRWLWEHRHNLEHYPLHHKLAGYYKRRLGNYRVVYRWDPRTNHMTIRRVRTRDTVYKELIRQIGA